MKSASFLFLLCLVSLSAFSAYAAEDPTRTALEARYAAFKAAVSSHNENALRNILAPNFTSLSINGQTANRDQMIESLQSADARDSE